MSSSNVNNPIHYTNLRDLFYNQLKPDEKLSNLSLVNLILHVLAVVGYILGLVLDIVTLTFGIDIYYYFAPLPSKTPPPTKKTDPQEKNMKDEPSEVSKKAAEIPAQNINPNEQKMPEEQSNIWHSIDLGPVKPKDINMDASLISLPPMMRLESYSPPLTPDDFKDLIQNKPSSEKHDYAPYIKILCLIIKNKFKNSFETSLDDQYDVFCSLSKYFQCFQSVMTNLYDEIKTLTFPKIQDSILNNFPQGKDLTHHVYIPKQKDASVVIFWDIFWDNEFKLTFFQTFNISSTQQPGESPIQYCIPLNQVEHSSFTKDRDPSIRVTNSAVTFLTKTFDDLIQFTQETVNKFMGV